MTDKISHYSVKVAQITLHAVCVGDAHAVLERLRNDDPLWTRPSVLLVDCKDLGDWFGPFPSPGHIKFWVVEED
jgi:hypothetical protein